MCVYIRDAFRKKGEFFNYQPFCIFSWFLTDVTVGRVLVYLAKMDQWIFIRFHVKNKLKSFNSLQTLTVAEVRLPSLHWAKKKNKMSTSGANSSRKTKRMLMTMTMPTLEPYHTKNRWKRWSSKESCYGELSNHY